MSAYQPHTDVNVKSYSSPLAHPTTAHPGLQGACSSNSGSVFVQDYNVSLRASVIFLVFPRQVGANLRRAKGLR